MRLSSPCPLISPWPATMHVRQAKRMAQMNRRMAGIQRAVDRATDGARKTNGGVEGKQRAAFSQPHASSLSRHRPAVWQETKGSAGRALLHLFLSEDGRARNLRFSEEAAIATGRTPPLHPPYSILQPRPTSATLSQSVSCLHTLSLTHTHTLYGTTPASTPCSPHHTPLPSPRPGRQDPNPHTPSSL